MKLTPLHALARSMMVGAAGGLVLALGVVIWRAISEDAVGGTALAFLGAAVATAALGIPAMRWSYGRSMRSADDSAVFAGVLTGMIAGKSLFKQKTYYRETESSSGRFERSREVASQRA